MASVEEHEPEQGAIDDLSDYLNSAGAEQSRRTAKALLLEFGSVGRILSASSSRLRRVVGPRLGALIHASYRLMQASLFEQVRRGPVLSRREDVLHYLQLQIGSVGHEKVMAFLLDSRLHLLRVVDLSEGNVASSSADIPRIIHLALDEGASGILIVHNHPSGDPNPSKSDLSWTWRLERIAADLGLRLVDHVIIAGTEARSVLHRYPDELKNACS